MPASGQGGGGGSTTVSALPRGYIDGFILSNDTDAEHDILVGPGEARDSADGANITLATGITKQIDVDWAEGDDAGGFPSGLTLTADTWYHVFAILNGTTVDAGFDSDLSATNLLTDASDFTEFRRLGSVRTNSSSNIIAFTQVSDHFIWSDPPLDFNSTITTTASLIALRVPPGVQVLADVNCYSTVVGFQNVYLSPPAANDEAPSTTAAPLGSLMSQVSGADHTAARRVLTNTARQIRARSSVATTTFRVATLGWCDLRGKA